MCIYIMCGVYSVIIFLYNKYNVLLLDFWEMIYLLLIIVNHTSVANLDIYIYFASRRPGFEISESRLFQCSFNLSNTIWFCYQFLTYNMYIYLVV